MYNRVKIDILLEHLSSASTLGERQDADILMINISNSCSIDILSGRVSVLENGDRGEKVAEFNFVNARGGFDSKYLSLAGDIRGIEAKFKLLNEETVEADVEIHDTDGRKVVIALTDR
jgi:hypothetical protein